MGSNIQSTSGESKQTLEQYLQKVEYIMQTSNPHFGTFKIYKMLEKPFEYIMRKDYTAMIEDHLLEKRKQRYQKMPNNRSLISFDFTILRQVEERCSKHLELSTFCRYYFFSLQEAILKKIKKQIKFPQQQIIYVAKTLISVYQSFHQISNQQCNLFKAASIFLSPEGFIKIYPFIHQWKEQMQQQQQTMRSSRKFFSFSSQHQVQLDLGKQKRDLTKIEKYQNDLFDIGVILLSIICLAKQTDYRNAQGNVKQDMLRFILNSYSQSDNKNLQIFRNLLKGIFQYKWPIQKIKGEIQVIENINNIKSVTRIKIVYNENQDSEVTINSEFLDKKKQSRLKTLSTRNLVPGRIKCYSACTTNSIV